jgi:hypothetical protein
MVRLEEVEDEEFLRSGEKGLAEEDEDEYTDTGTHGLSLCDTGS